MSGFKSIIRSLWVSCLLVCLVWKVGCRSAAPSTDIPSVGTHVVKTEAGFQLYRDGEPFRIKGACVIGLDELPELKDAGANTVRTYPGADLDAVFEVADSLGLAVIAGLDVPPARFGVDYQDASQVEKIKNQLVEQVQRYKNHPSLLMWGVGNEVNLLANDEHTLAIYRAIDEFSRIVHQLDSLHPTTYMANGPRVIPEILSTCQSLDIISVNTFRSLGELSQVLRYSEWLLDKPILISEWAPLGYWSAPANSWGAPLERNAEEKAYSIAEYYRDYLADSHPLIIGDCMFLWGQKQEQTHTWFSSFSEQGEATTIVDQMHYLWSGSYPENRAPLAQAIQVDTFKIKNEIFLEQGRTYQAVGYAKDDNGDSLTYDWEITPEYERHGITGGDREERPHAMPHLFEEARGDTLLFQAPDTTGAYRLYFYARDGRGKVGITNVPFYVLPPAGLQLRTEK